MNPRSSILLPQPGTIPLELRGPVHHWPASYTTDLLDLINVIGELVATEDVQAELLEQVCAGSLLTDEEFEESRESNRVRKARGKAPDPNQTDLLSEG